MLGDAITLDVLGANKSEPPIVANGSSACEVASEHVFGTDRAESDLVALQCPGAIGLAVNTEAALPVTVVSAVGVEENSHVSAEAIATVVDFNEEDATNEDLNRLITKIGSDSLKS